MKNTHRAYIAGLVDGEGCITIAKRKNGHHKEGKGRSWYYSPIVTIANTDKRMVDFVVNCYKGWITKPKPQKSHYKQLYAWFIGGDRMKEFLKDILPYLIVKRKQAEIVLAFPCYKFGLSKRKTSRTKEEIEEQDSLWKRIKELND